MNRCGSHDRRQETEYFLSKLKEHGGRITEQRKALARAIIQFRGPFSAEDLFDKIKAKSIDLVTIYRSLHTFNRIGLLVTVDFSDGVVRYEYLSKEQSHHHHVICTECKTIQPLKFCVVIGQEQLVEQMGYTDVFHKLEFFGLCKRCAA